MVAAALVVSSLLAACGGGSAGGSDDLSGETVKMGVAVLPPFVIKDGDDVTGDTPEIARAVKQVDAGFGPGGAVVVGVPRPLARLVPLAGAPVGFGIDYAFARAVGNRAIAHYRLQASDPDLR